MNKYLVLLIGVILLSGCSPTPNEVAPHPSEPTLVLDAVKPAISKVEQEEVLKQYYNLLKINGNQDGIVNFIDNNIEKLDSENVDVIIVSLEEYLLASSKSIDEISTTLMEYYDNTSGEIQYYLDILDREAQMPFTDGEAINVELNELLDRMVQAEEYLKKFPQSMRKTKVYDYYKAYIIGSISGAGNQYIFAEDGSSTIKDSVINDYNRIIENYKDFSSSKVLNKYLEALALDNNDLNGENTLKFYENIEIIIQENSSF